MNLLFLPKEIIGVIFVHLEISDWHILFRTSKFFNKDLVTNQVITEWVPKGMSRHFNPKIIFSDYWIKRINIVKPVYGTYLHLASNMSDLMVNAVATNNFDFMRFYINYFDTSNDSLPLQSIMNHSIYGKPIQDFFLNSKYYSFMDHIRNPLLSLSLIIGSELTTEFIIDYLFEKNNHSPGCSVNGTMLYALNVAYSTFVKQRCIERGWDFTKKFTVLNSFKERAFRHLVFGS